MKRNGRKKWILAAIALILVAAIGAGIFFVTRSGGEPVGVYSFDYLGMTEYWGDSQESYGPVTTDKIQTVFLSDTQKVTEILVAEGDMVQKGDILMTCDTTLSDLQVQRKELEIEKLNLELSETRGYLISLRKMDPIDPNVNTDPGEQNLGVALTEPYKLSPHRQFDGSSAEKPFVCWVKDTTDIGNNLMELIRQQCEEYQNENAQLEAQQPPSSGSAPQEGAAPETTPPATQAPETQPPVTAPATEPSAPTETQPLAPTETQPSVPGETQPSTQPTLPPYINVEDFYVIFKVTKDNMSLGEYLQWQGMHVTKQGSGFHFQFFDASVISDYTVVNDGPAVNVPEVGVGYTSAELKKMIAEQVKKIGELELNIRMAEAELKIMQSEKNDGNVYAQIDGKVVTLLPEEEARATQQPLMKLSGGGGFYIQGSVSELEKDNLKIGQEVTINDWNSGMTYTGQVESISDIPDNDSGFSGMGNPNASYYPFQVFVDESADLRAGSYVSVTYSTSEGGNGIYLQNPFLRTENGQSYVYLKGEDGKLEKRIVTTGKSLWGSYTQILEGITSEDLIAFPYGKDVKEGAPTVESDISELYDY